MINTDRLISAAREKAGITGQLQPAVAEGLNKLVDSLNSEAPLNERGWQSIEAAIISNLSNRFKVEHYLKQHPELLNEPIDRPMFVFGLPRTGTTLVINLLNEDPARRCFLRWESLASVPPPKPNELSSGPRYAACQQMTELALKHTPQIAAIHYENADSPTECQFAMSQSFCAQYWEAIAEVPGYRDWFLKADYRPAFEYQKQLLQLLQSEAPGRWTLKNPWHPLFLDDLSTIYPDAQFVMTHRDPLEVVGSCCSLIKHVRLMMSDKVDLNYIGRSMMDTFATMIERTIAYKEKHGWDSIYDLQYNDVLHDPIGEMKKIYNHFNEPWSINAELSMQNYLENNPKNKLGKHQYNLEDYGLNQSMVRERFADYCNQFEISIKD